MRCFFNLFWSEKEIFDTDPIFLNTPSINNTNSKNKDILHFSCSIFESYYPIKSVILLNLKKQSNRQKFFIFILANLDLYDQSCSLKCVNSLNNNNYGII